MSDLSEPGHGNSPAAWTAVVIMLVGFAIGTVAFFASWAWLVYVSAVIVVLGLIAGWALARAGYGVNGDKAAPKAHS